MSRRQAILIGNQSFHPESDLTPLQGPLNDVEALARVLRHPDRGGFDVLTFADRSSHEVLPEIEQALGSAEAGDFILIFYSGHGSIDRSGRLCLATANTRRSALVGTSLPARQIRDFVEDSHCDQVLMLLDCCYSGAIEDGLKGSVRDELHLVEEASGFYILTASTGLQVSREAALPDGLVMGRFTAALVQGMETGAADATRRGRILLSDLRQYVGRVVSGQTPQFFARRAIGDPIISFCPVDPMSMIDPSLLGDLGDAQWHRRRGAVHALADLAREETSNVRTTVLTVLQQRLTEERDFVVRQEIERTLRALGDRVAKPLATEPVEITAPVLGVIGTEKARDDAVKADGPPLEARPTKSKMFTIFLVSSLLVFLTCVIVIASTRKSSGPASLMSVILYGNGFFGCAIGFWARDTLSAWKRFFILAIAMSYLLFGVVIMSAI